MTERAQNADFRRKPQIFADSPLLLESPAFGGRRKPQKTADFRSKPKIFAENRRLGSVTLGASPLALPYFQYWTWIESGLPCCPIVVGPIKTHREQQASSVPTDQLYLFGKVHNKEQVDRSPALPSTNPSTGIVAAAAAVGPAELWRKIKGQHDEGQQDREVLRGKSASKRVSERTSDSEGCRGFQRFSETLSEADFPLRGSRSCCPYSCCPLFFLQELQAAGQHMIRNHSGTLALKSRKYPSARQCVLLKPLPVQKVLEN